MVDAAATASAIKIRQAIVDVQLIIRAVFRASLRLNVVLPSTDRERLVESLAKACETKIPTIDSSDVSKTGEMEMSFTRLASHFARATESVVTHLHLCLDELQRQGIVGHIQRNGPNVAAFRYGRLSLSDDVIGETTNDLVEIHNGSLMKRVVRTKHTVAERALTLEHHTHVIRRPTFESLPANNVPMPDFVQQLVEVIPDWLSDSVKVVTAPEFDKRVRTELLGNRTVEGDEVVFDRKRIRPWAVARMVATGALVGTGTILTALAAASTSVGIDPCITLCGRVVVGWTPDEVSPQVLK